MQIQAIFLLNYFFIIYVGHSKPFHWFFDNRLELFNTTFISLLFIGTITYTEFIDWSVLDDNLIGIIGIALVSIFVGVNLLVILY